MDARCVYGPDICVTNSSIGSKDCPPPLSQEEFELQEEESGLYVRDRISFLVRNPGQQLMTGSFRPIDTGDWTISAYRSPFEDLLNAIAQHDFELVRTVLSDRVANVNGRTLDGWTPLQLAIKCDAYEIVPDLVRSGARWPRLGNLPAYQEDTHARIGTWPLGEQVEKLACLFEELLQQFA